MLREVSLNVYVNPESGSSIWDYFLHTQHSYVQESMAGNGNVISNHKLEPLKLVKFLSPVYTVLCILESLHCRKKQIREPQQMIAHRLLERNLTVSSLGR